jgi:acetyltransferase-like isoleucine patch superfamily enzyme
MKLALLVINDILGCLFVATEVAFPATFAALTFQWAFGHFGWLGVFLISPLVYQGALLSFCLGIFVLRLLIPRLPAGEFAIATHPVTRSWAVNLQIARLPQMAGVRPFFMGGNFTRFFFLRALGAKVAFKISTASDVYIYDASMVEIGEGALIGGASGISGHFAEKGKLTLLRTVIGEGCQLGTAVIVGPGTVLGKRITVASYTRFFAHITVGEKTHVGHTVTIEPFCTIGSRVIIGNRVVIQGHCEIGDRAVIESGSVVPKGTKIPAGTRYPVEAV